jgi:hypothetical protein
MRPLVQNPTAPKKKKKRKEIKTEKKLKYLSIQLKIITNPLHGNIMYFMKLAIFPQIKSNSVQRQIVIPVCKRV